MIREYRLKKNLTQEQLAEKLDISSRHLQRLEYEEDRTTVKTLKKIVKVLDIPNDEILKYIGKKSS
ncbi:MAG: helix-turn-helix transcriptional regulator [Clostridia bacterium]|nr:helix-turn-helix transcriptional regulator [Clostridia bacterium]